MGLASFLLNTTSENADKGKSIDKGLDDLFRSALPTQPGPSSVNDVVNTKTKTFSISTQAEKRKRVETDSAVKPKRLKSGKEKDSENKKEVVRHTIPAKSKRTSSKKVHNDSSEDEGDATTHVEIRRKTEDIRTEHDSDETDSDEEGDPSKLVHESLLKKGSTSKNASKAKAKFIPLDETPDLRRARTIFVGNVPIEVVKSKSSQKHLKRHVLSFVPTAKIESMRFRSVAFKNPTSKLPPLDGSAESKSKPNVASIVQDKEGRQHDRDRAASWRATKDADQDEPSKNFLTSKEKKRVAFIKQEFHEGVDSVHAYIVFAYPPPPEARPANLPPPSPVMDPYEAAKSAAELCDGSVFMERTLRADVDGRKAEPGAGDVSNPLPGDPRTTIFVGNLDFASKEEDLRVFFEGLVSAERGPPEENEGASGDTTDEEDEDEDDTAGKSDVQAVTAKKPPTWVKRVRIIRDKETQLGKGFAFVQFIDRECVDEILALEPDKVKFAKRKLRVQRCKVIPKGGNSKQPKSPRTPQANTPSTSTKSSGSRNAGQVPRGDPALGTKIQHLPKEERKKVKASDADRVARRMAKKKAKLLTEKGVKSRVDRPRVRKRPGEKSAAGPNKEKAKRRVRSDKAISKMNTKK